MKKRYESRLFTLGLFLILGLGLMATALDPTGIVKGNGANINFGSLSGMNLTLFWVGMVMVHSGVAIRIVAIVTLKRNFSGGLRIRDGHTLTKNGIYKWIRHPAYLGAVILYPGISVLASSLLGFLVMLLLVPYLIHRIKLEERMLTERFGAEYEAYIDQTKKLIPFLY